MGLRAKGAKGVTSLLLLMQCKIARIDSARIEYCHLI